MPDLLAEKIICALDHAASLYHRLILVVAPSGAGKTAALQTVQQQTGARLINLNLELSRQLLELTERQRTLQMPRLLAELMNGTRTDPVLLDNIELLFDVSLQQDPLRLLQGLSRNQTVVAAWGGVCDDRYLTYAAPDHPEYRRYSNENFLVVTPAAA